MYTQEQMNSEQFLIDQGWVSMKYNPTGNTLFLCPIEEWQNVPSGSMLTTVWGSKFCKSSFDSKNVSYKHNNGFYDFGIEISDFVHKKNKYRSIDEPFEPSMKHNHNNDGKQVVFWQMSSC